MSDRDVRNAALAVEEYVYAELDARQRGPDPIASEEELDAWLAAMTPTLNDVALAALRRSRGEDDQ